MTSLPHTTHGVNDPMPAVTEMTETEWFDAWSNGDKLTIGAAYEHYVTAVTPHGWYTVTDRDTGFEYATERDCSCRGIYPNERPDGIPPCAHMLAVRRYHQALASLDNPRDDHDGIMTATMP